MSKKNKKLKAEPETARYARQTNMTDYTLTTLYWSKLQAMPGNPSAVWGDAPGSPGKTAENAKIDQNIFY